MSVLDDAIMELRSTSERYTQEYLDKAFDRSISFREKIDIIRLIHSIEGWQAIVSNKRGYLDHSWLPLLVKK